MSASEASGDTFLKPVEIVVDDEKVVTYPPKISDRHVVYYPGKACANKKTQPATLTYIARIQGPQYRANYISEQLTDFTFYFKDTVILTLETV